MVSQHIGRMIIFVTHYQLRVASIPNARRARHRTRVESSPRLARWSVDRHDGACWVSAGSKGGLSRRLKGPEVPLI